MCPYHLAIVIISTIKNVAVKDHMKNKANNKKNQTKMDPQMIKMIESDTRNKRQEKENILRIYFKK